MGEKEIDTFYPQGKAEWRAWLQENHAEKQSIWIVCYKKEAGIPTISWSDAVDEALCFGWIDSTRKSLDNGKFIQFFSRRKAGSTWSKINKEKVEKLILDGSMTEAGLKSIEIAKQNGSWSVLDAVEALEIPDDLEKSFAAHEGAKDFFMNLSKSARKMILHRIVLAKRPETRQKRIEEITSLIAQGRNPVL